MVSLNPKSKFFLIFLSIFIIGALLYAILSTKTGIHDTGEYITTAKELAGIGNIKVFSSHAILYTLLMAQFLKVFPSLLTLKILSVFWLVLISVILWFYTKSKKVFLLWMFSPLVWFVTVEISPLFPAAVCILLGYIGFKKYEKNEKLSYLLFSGLFFGLASSFYFPPIILTCFFVISFFFNKPLKLTLLFLIGFIISFSIGELLIDYIFFNFALTSIVRYIGVNIVMMLGLSPNKPPQLTLISILYILFLITPVLFYLYKINLKKYKREIIFIGLCVLFFVITNGAKNSIKYYIMFSPIIIMLVAKTINKKILVISIIASIFIIVLVTHSYFGSNDISLITQDLKEINKDYNFKEFIAGEDQALVLASHSWTKSPRIIWWEDYQLSIQNKTVYREYSIETKPTFDQSQILEITTKLKRSGNQTFEGVPLILINDQSAPQIPPENFKLLKCYNILCVYSQD